MKKITLVAAALLFVGSSALGYAADRDRGASGYSPGDRMHDTGRKASQFAPGHQPKGYGGDPGHSGSAPGDKMNDRRGR